MRIPLLLKQYAAHLRDGQLEAAMERMETASSLALSAAAVVMRELGHEGTPEKWGDLLRQRILPHHNREGLSGREKALSSMLKDTLAKCPGDGSAACRVELSRAWMDLAAACAMAPVYHEARQIKARQKQEREQAHVDAPGDPESAEPEPAVAGLSMEMG